MPLLQLPRPPDAAPAESEASTRAALDRLREAAQAEGYAVGHQAGFEAGHREGCAAGHAEGHAAALEEGRCAASEALAVHLAEMDAMAQALRDGLQDLDARVGDALIALAAEMARTIVGDTCTLRPDTLHRALQTALQSLEGATRVTLRVHPAALQGLLADGAFAEATAVDAGPLVHLVADATLARDDYCLDSDAGDIDGRLITRWRAVLGSLGLAQPAAPAPASPDLEVAHG